MERLILIKYGELTTKKENRKMFIKMLADNIRSLLKEYEFKMEYDRVRMYITCDNKYIDEIANKLSKIFGIHSIVICHKVDNNTDNIKNKVKEILSNIAFKTFKVETKR
ncbi:MAG: tRNA 4-thiouridine(8) synthase ThiI, partial [Bacilli bacterium]|nr:tRNA 4-thiouridine(8) synthase ThiI [Bacilli bacterium]